MNHENFRINFAMVGSGPVAEYHLDTLKKNKFASPCGIYTRNRTRADELTKKFKIKQYENFEELISDEHVEAVDICNANRDHFPTAQKVLVSNKNIIVEKPVAFRSREVFDLKQCAKKNNLIASAVLQKRYNKILDNLNCLIQGELGKVLFTQSFIYMPRSENYYKRLEKSSNDYAGGGVLIYQAIHDIDLLILLFGKVEGVSAMKDNLHHKIDVEDTCSALLKHENGVNSYVHASTIPCLPAFNVHILVGPEKFIIFDDMKLVLFPNKYFTSWQRHWRCSGKLDHLWLRLTKLGGAGSLVGFIAKFYNCLSYGTYGIKKYGPRAPGSYKDVLDDFVMKLTAKKKEETRTSIASTIETHRVLEKIYNVC